MAKRSSLPLEIPSKSFGRRNLSLGGSSSRSSGSIQQKSTLNPPSTTSNNPYTDLVVTSFHNNNFVSQKQAITKGEKSSNKEDGAALSIADLSLDSKPISRGPKVICVDDETTIPSNHLQERKLSQSMYEKVKEKTLKQAKFASMHRGGQSKKATPY